MLAVLPGVRAHCSLYLLLYCCDAGSDRTPAAAAAAAAVLAIPRVGCNSRAL